MIAGVKDTLPYPADGGIGGAGGGSGGTGGASTCAPGSEIDCYSGPDGTKGVGICKAGKQTCRMDGSGYDACVGEAKPEAESCAAPDDENCDGHDCVQWAELFGDGADQQATALAVDASGNIFVVGTFAGEIALNGVKIGSKGSTDAFVLKLDPSGKLLWGQAFGDVGTQAGQAVTVDSTGSVIVAGFSATAFSAGDPQMTTVPAGLFVVKLDGDGKVLWSNGFGALGCGGIDDSAIAAMAVTSGNDVVIAGRYCGSIDFGNGAIPSQMGSQDGFVALLGGGSGSATSGSGWSKVFGDGMTQEARGLAIGGPLGEIVMVGSFGGAITLGSGAPTMNSMGGSDMFFAKLLPDGTPTISSRFGDAKNQTATAVAIDKNGNFAITGQFEGDLDFGTAKLAASNVPNNAYVVEFDSSNAHQWSRSLGGGGFFGGAADIAFDGAGNLIAAGIFAGSIDFGAGPTSAIGANFDVFLAKLTTAGKEYWLKTFNSGPGVMSTRMTLIKSGAPILTGFVSGQVDFGTGSLLVAGNRDGYLAQFAQ